MAWILTGDNQNLCTVHKTHTARGVPCPSCLMDPKVEVTDRDEKRVSSWTCKAHETVLTGMATYCMRLAYEIADGVRPVNERTEPLELARKFIETAIKAQGRAVGFAEQREQFDNDAKNREVVLAQLQSKK